MREDEVSGDRTPRVTVGGVRVCSERELQLVVGQPTWVRGSSRTGCGTRRWVGAGGGTATSTVAAAAAGAARHAVDRGAGNRAKSLLAL